MERVAIHKAQFKEKPKRKKNKNEVSYLACSRPESKEKRNTRSSDPSCSGLNCMLGNDQSYKIKELITKHCDL